TYLAGISAPSANELEVTVSIASPPPPRPPRPPAWAPAPAPRSCADATPSVTIVTTTDSNKDRVKRVRIGSYLLMMGGGSLYQTRDARLARRVALAGPVWPSGPSVLNRT